MKRDTLLGFLCEQSMRTAIAFVAGATTVVALAFLLAAGDVPTMIHAQTVLTRMVRVQSEVDPSDSLTLNAGVLKFKSGEVSYMLILMKDTLFLSRQVGDDVTILERWPDPERDHR